MTVALKVLAVLVLVSLPLMAQEPAPSTLATDVIRLMQRVAELEKIVKTLQANAPAPPTNAEKAKRTRDGLKAECAANGLTFKGIQIDRATGKSTTVCE